MLPSNNLGFSLLRLGVLLALASQPACTGGSDCATDCAGSDCGDDGCGGGCGTCDDGIDCTSDTCVSGECSYVPDDESCPQGQVCSSTLGCVDTPSIPEISLAPSTTSGVAPLGVFFDTEGTVSDTTDLPVHELDYAWDFGAGTEDDLSSGGRYFKGFNATHVFETPGTFEVTLTVKDVNGTEAQQTVAIEVAAEPAGGWETYCFSNSADFADCPAGATHISTTFWGGDAGQDVLDFVGPNRRLLLRRGDTFAYTETAPVGDGLLLFAPFGSGSPPVIQFTGNRPNSWEYGAMVSLGENVKFVDLHFQLNSGQGEHGGIGGSGILLLRVFNEHGGCTLGDDIFVVDSVLTNPSGNPAYAAGERITVLNTEFGPSYSHSVYGECQPKAIYAGNHFHDVENVGRTGIRLAANTCSSHNILLSDNHFENITLQAVQLEVTTHNDERFRERDIVIERNRFSQSGGVYVSREHGFNNISIRNNIFDLGSEDLAIVLSDQVAYHPEWARGVEGLWVYNNLFYNHSTAYPAWAPLVNLDQEDALDVVFINNIFSAQGIGDISGWIRAMSIHPGMLGELSFSNNLYHLPDLANGELFEIRDVGTGDLAWWQSYDGHGLGEGSITGDPLFIDDANHDFRPQPNSPGIDSGREVGFVFDDIDGTDRRTHAPWDIGPHEYH